MLGTTLGGFGFALEVFEAFNRCPHQGLRFVHAALIGLSKFLRIIPTLGNDRRQKLDPHHSVHIRVTHFLTGRHHLAPPGNEPRILRVVQLAHSRQLR